MKPKEKKKFNVKYREIGGTVTHCVEFDAESRGVAETELMIRFFCGKLDVKPRGDKGLNRIEILKE